MTGGRAGSFDGAEGADPALLALAPSRRPGALRPGALRPSALPVDALPVDALRSGGL